MHAIQASFCALQIADNMEKWLKMVARGGPKNHEKSILGPSRAPLCASLLNLITRMLPKDTHMTENGHLVTLILGSTSKLSGAVLFEDPFAGWGLAGQHSEGSIKLNRCKPCISSNPSLTSGCNHKGGRRQGRSLRNIYIYKYLLSSSTFPKKLMEF